MNLKKNCGLLLAAFGSLVCFAYAMPARPSTKSGTMACVADKWNETEKEKGHKLVESSVRCVLIPDNPAAPKVTEVCPGNYEYLPDEQLEVHWNLHGHLSGRGHGHGDLGGGVAPQGVHVQKYRRHGQIQGRDRRRHRTCTRT